ncbi:MAG: CinA family protein [Proteobacteria bacterium]|jgi:nicotinamide-nucleotide amidase|nr:damage-inducible protein CinA [Methylibium sp.]MBY0368562.1 CinA family protein [Burkholderiaceae bacterium]MCH8857262.1 CinA family protein [Pseudomonadota bacterium]|mmetsp:Transcript_49604/g.116494  ORF Transcript_49604/g.116494 Transcript_49604/m.116494 type:complete len:169 (+) Transcript_49604:811-1317(+)
MAADDTDLIERIALALIRRRESIGTAESCTGGLIAAACTGLPGSSAWFERGVVSYSNEAKSELLGVPTALIAQHGAVSAEVAEQMARGLLARAPIDWALSVTGIAGPTGGSPVKPVGTVWLALVRTGQPARVWREHFSGDRQQVRAQTVMAGLTALIEALEHAQDLGR